MPATDSRSASSIQVANAPCSWGRLEFEDVSEGEEIGYQQMLAELAATGYAGTELGEWGYMPTDPDDLRTELEQRDLAMVGAFVPVALRDPAAHENGKAQALRVAKLMASVSDDQQPYVILSDDNGVDPMRTQNAGRIAPEMGLGREEWETFADGAMHIARAVRDETGLPTAFHHHCAGYVETPNEIEQFLSMTDPNLIGLVLDTGHYAYGAGECRAFENVFDRFGERIWHVHFKDFDPDVARRAREEQWGYFEAVQHGVFCELGQGCVDFPFVIDQLQADGYADWVVVEQDVLPGVGTPRASAQRNRNYLREIGL